MDTAAHSFSPVILFDGKCNLCHGSVAWVIERDRRDRFRFASLQSEAAARILDHASPGAAIADLPDSMVLIDEAGVHTQSTAAIRIARGLGWPWPLAAALTIVPKPLRDWGYSLIARNRHRWFGTRDTCMAPTADLRARFLDADEWSAPPEAAENTTAPTIATPKLAQPKSGSAGPVWSFLLRCILVYILLYLIPFPFGSFPKGVGIPGTNWIADQYEALMHAFVPWVGEVVFGAEITIFPAGSGDTTYNYVELFVYAVFAVLGAGVWTVLRRGKPVSPRTFDRATVYVRYFLAATMFVYGIDKILLLQFPAPGPDRLMITYGESSPFGLLWTSLGASAPYQFFGGLAEAVGAVLLLWRRTVLLGALVTAGVLLNVVMLNFCYDVPVKIFSTHLLLLSLFIAAPHTGRLMGMLVLNLPTAATTLRPFPVRQPWIRRALLAFKVLFIAWITIGQTWQIHEMIAPMRRVAADNPLHGSYRVESLTIGGVSDRDLPDAKRWIHVGMSGLGGAAVRRADGSIERLWMQRDPQHKTITIPTGGGAEPAVLTYEWSGDGLLTLDGRFGGEELSVRLRRIDEPSNLTGRGFNWINEFPYYR